MNGSVDGFVGLAIGIALGALITLFFDAVNAQTEYTEGRKSVLNSTVTVGGEDTPCAASIPLSVLAEMVNAGVMDWHRVCEGGDQ